MTTGLPLPDPIKYITSIPHWQQSGCRVHALFFKMTTGLPLPDPIKYLIPLFHIGSGLAAEYICFSLQGGDRTPPA